MFPSIGARLDAVIDGAIAAERIIGTVVLVSLRAAPVYARAAGLADREAGLVMREDTLFRYSSVSKLFVAACAVALVGQGVLDLDRPITHWLPDFEPIWAGEKASITLRQLLTHTAGLGYTFVEPVDGPLHKAGVSAGMDRSGISLTENMRRLAGVPLNAAPGTVFAYSLGIDAAGAVIEAATGLALPAAMQTYVTGPLGITETGFTLAAPARLAAAYVDDTPQPRRMAEPETVPLMPGLAGLELDPLRAFDDTAFPSGGAGMIGTAQGVLCLLEALRQGGAPIMPPELAALMGRDQIGGLAIEGAPGWGYGLGFSVLRDSRAAGVAESPGTWRWGGVYGHSWFADPARELSVVALTNTALEGMSNWGRFPTDLSRALYAALAEPC
jgi:CubicO group peptidase (beta-lactamase class C family)